MTATGQEISASEFVVRDQPMIAARDAAQALIYRRIDFTAGVWLVAQQVNEADDVYYHNPKDIHSDGFGGATLRFPLVDGGEYVAKGPWKANAGKLFQDTGYDCREKHRSFVVIGRDGEFRKSPRSYMGSNRVIKDIVYRDETGGGLGSMYRYKQILSTLADGEYWFYSETPGGSVAGKQAVDAWWRAEIQAGRFNPDRPRAERRA